MPTPNGRSFAIGRVVMLIVAALIVTTPASAQFGALKKKLKGEAAQKAAEKAVEAAGVDASAVPGAATETGSAPVSARAAAPTGGMLVLNAEVVDRLVAGLKARAAEREAARKQDTPYGRYHTGLAAYEVAKPKCEAAMPGFYQRLAADRKLADKYTAITDKMSQAQAKGDQARATEYQYQALGLADPSCTVREPVRPENLYEAERDVDNRAEQAALKTADLTATEFGQASDRAIGILTGNTGLGDGSPAEKAAVNAKAADLKPLLDIRDPQEERVSKAAPAPAPAPAPVQAPTIPPGAPTVSDCQVKNIEKHQAEIDALGERGSAAQQAGNTPLMMAIADSINRIQFAGCAKGH